jgi:cyclopropane-fatty-acyl-phospholipid synthase
MVYSCAYFHTPETTLEEAQLAKLDHICRKLDVQPGDRFLDIGSGWGALLAHAAGRYGAAATGCTISRAQYEFACARLEGRARVLELDYRDLTGHYDKIASVGMFEHVGRAQLEQYFRKIYSLLTPSGLFLNHGITRPSSVPVGAETMFLVRKVFPGSQIVRLDEVIRAAEAAGFEVLDVENLYRHYARTTHIWVERLTANREECLKVVDGETWRTWRLYLAGCSIAFEKGEMGLHQVLLAKRGASYAVPMTREYMYGKAAD